MLPKKHLESKKRKQPQLRFDDRWMGTVDSPTLYCEAGKTRNQMQDERVAGLSSEDLCGCELPSMYQTLVRCFVAVV